MKARGLAPLLLSAFLFGGGSAEVAVQTGRALSRARAERQVGAAGDLVALEVKDEEGVLARPRLIAPLGRPAQLVLRDPADPSLIRLWLRVATAREPSGDITLDWQLLVPSRQISAGGRASVAPGVEHALDLGDGAVQATLLALPVPSAAFDAYLEAEELRAPLGDAI